MQKFIHGGNVWGEGSPDMWVDFSANLDPKGPPQIMIDTLRENLDKIMYYPEVNMELPSTNIANYLGVPPEQILPTSGGIGALSLITEEIRPSRIAILQPGFVEYMRLAQNVDAEVLHIPIVSEGKVFYPQDMILEVLEENTMVFICNPSNPIGTTMPRDMMLAILEAAERKGAKIVVDEAFIEFAQEESVKKLVGKYSCLIVAGSLTKIFAIPGIRLGYICANEDLIASFKQRQTPWTLSSFACDVTNTLQETEAYILDSLRENEIQRQYLIGELESLGFTVYPSKANFLLLNLREKNIKVQDLQDALLKENILIRNCSSYIYLDEYYTRIAVKNAEDNKYLIKTLRKYLGELL